MWEIAGNGGKWREMAGSFGGKCRKLRGSLWGGGPCEISPNLGDFWPIFDHFLTQNPQNTPRIMENPSITSVQVKYL